MGFRDSRNLRIVADDFGLTESINEGILLCLRQNLITSVSILPSGQAFNHAVENLQSFSSPDVGIHLTLVEEHSILPESEISSLICSQGTFYKKHWIFFLRYMLQLIRPADIEREFRAQIGRCLQAGLQLRFLNSHQHLHLLPGITDITIQLAREHQIPYIRIVKEPGRIRMKKLFRRLQLSFLHLLSKSATRKIRSAGLQYNDVFFGFMNAGNLQNSDLRSAFGVAKSHPEFLVELGCHPGFSDEVTVRKFAGWGDYRWSEEVETLREYQAAE